MSEAIKQAGDALTAVAAYPEIRQYIGTVLHDQIREALAALSAEQPKPVAWLIDWPDEPELGHYFAEEPSEMGRNTPLYASPIAAPASQSDAWNTTIEAAASFIEDINDAQPELASPDLPARLRALRQPAAAAIRNKALEAAICGCLRALRTAWHISGVIQGREDIAHTIKQAEDALATQSEPAQQEPAMQIDMAEEEMTRLYDFLETERPVSLIVTDGRCGYGLYAFDTEYPDEMAEFITAVGKDAAPTAQQEPTVCGVCNGRGERDIAHGETAPCPNCGGTGIVRGSALLAQQAGQPAPALPDNCVIVPKEPTQEMCLAARREVAEYPIKDDASSPVVIYRAMINAAPAQGEKK